MAGRSRPIAIVFILTLFVAHSAPGQLPDRKIEATEAAKLVQEGIKKHSPNAEMHVLADPYDREFLYFQATWPNPVGSPVIGNFAVNPWTGGVWDANGCHRITSPSLTRKQEAIRKRFHLTKQEYLKLNARRPLCGGE